MKLTEWKKTRLKYLVNLNPKKEEARRIPLDTEVTFIPMEKIIRTGLLDCSLTNTIENLINGYTYFRDEDIIIAKVTPCFENGNVAIAKGLKNGMGFGTTELHVLRCGKYTNNKFIFYFLQSNLFKSKAVSEMYGVAGLKRIPAEFFLNYKINFPDINEQIEICNFLDQRTSEIDSLIADKEKLIELLQEKRQAIISEAVTKGLDKNVKMKDSGIEWIGEVPEEWEVKKLKFICSLISKGTTPSTIGQEITFTGEIRFIKAENIKDNEIAVEPEFYINRETNIIIKRSQLEENDILFVIAGATIGKTAILQKNFLPANTNQAISFIRLNSLGNSRFVWYWLQTDIIDKIISSLSVQSAQPNLSMEDLGNFPLLYPSLNEQEKIVEFLDAILTKIGCLILDISKQINKLKDYRQSVISEAVTGKIMV